MVTMNLLSPHALLKLKKNVYAMMRQKGPPTLFLTFSAESLIVDISYFYLPTQSRGSGISHLLLIQYYHNYDNSNNNYNKRREQQTIIYCWKLCCHFNSRDICWDVGLAF